MSLTAMVMQALIFLRDWYIPALIKFDIATMQLMVLLVGIILFLSFLLRKFLKSGLNKYPNPGCNAVSGEYYRQFQNSDKQSAFEETIEIKERELEEEDGDDLSRFIDGKKPSF